ncbi:hypothetical protein BD410DRAFT_845041 [Rickenella mellea]|uniref:Uncharacterized protein n=1 Tax=Rickenella mellea TaxID=50990 RepID=A0A4Y7PKB2_9AGAM|nr:hypothetical protein BD410DRAFT_845041 [Rickenella mellea]
MPTNNFPQLVFEAGKIALQQTPRAQVKQGRKHMDNGLYELYDNREIIEPRDKAALINKHDALEEMGNAIEGNTSQFLGSLQHMSRATTFKKQAMGFEDDVKKKSDESKKAAVRRDIENARLGGQGPSHTTIDTGAGRGQPSGRGPGSESARPPIPTAKRVQAIRDSIASAHQQETSSQQSPQNSSQASHQNPAGQGKLLVVLREY